MVKMFQLCGTLTDEELKNLDKTKWIKEPKIDGVRIMAFIDEGKVKLLDRSGNNKTKQFFDVAEELKRLKNFYILDGEIQSGGSFIKTMERAQEENDFKLKMKAKQDGTIFHVFDIKTVFDLTLIYRKEILDSFFGNNNFKLIRKIGYVRADWQDSRNWETKEGYVLKRIDSKYVPDNRENWLKYKKKLIDVFEILGSEMGKENLILTTKYGRVSVPRKGDIDFFFKHAPLRAKIEFMEMSEDLKFRQPIFKGFVGFV